MTEAIDEVNKDVCGPHLWHTLVYYYSRHTPGIAIKSDAQGFDFGDLHWTMTIGYVH